MSTHKQAQALYDDLENGAERVSWQIGKVVNALLGEATKEHPDNVALAAVEPFKPSNAGGFVASASTSDVRSIVGQIVAATEPETSEPATESVRARTERPALAESA